MKVGSMHLAKSTSAFLLRLIGKVCKWCPHAVTWVYASAPVTCLYGLKVQYQKHSTSTGSREIQDSDNTGPRESNIDILWWRKWVFESLGEKKNT